MVIRQGDVFWVHLNGGSPRPAVIIQNDQTNASRINSLIVCELTTNLRRINFPGNVQLLQGEANLPNSSLVNVSQCYTIDKIDLDEYIGTLSRRRVEQILGGLWLLLEPSRT